jgi:hypothetical protein
METVGDDVHLTCNAGVVNDTNSLGTGVMALIFDSSMLSVSDRMSTNTGTAPRSTKAFAMLTNVHDGMMSSSPGPMLASMAVISSAAVHESVGD